MGNIQHSIYTIFTIQYWITKRKIDHSGEIDIFLISYFSESSTTYLKNSIIIKNIYVFSLLRNLLYIYLYGIHKICLQELLRLYKDRPLLSCISKKLEFVHAPPWIRLVPQNC